MEPGAILDKTTRKTIRADMIGPFAKTLLWDAIMHRMRRLISLNNLYEEYDPLFPNAREDWKMEKPPSFDLDNILGYDMAVTIQYKGKELMEGIEERRTAGKRLVGTYLLRVGSGYREFYENTSTEDFINYFEQAGLLDKTDAVKVRFALGRDSLR